MKFLLASLSVMVFLFPAFGQTSSDKSDVCTDEVSKNISSRGIKIGANINDVFLLIAATEEEKNKKIFEHSSDENIYGFRIFSIAPNGSPSVETEKFAGIENYMLYFLDGKLIGLNIGYTKHTWEDNEKFTTLLSEIFNLPKTKNWQLDPNGLARIQCGNYLIYTQLVNNKGIFSIFDGRTKQILDDRKRKTSNEQFEKDLKTFKP